MTSIRIKIIERLAWLITGIGVDFMTYRFFSKVPVIRRQNDLKNKSLAIIVQGPPLLENDFTLNTLEYYSLLLPSNCLVVYSCWVGDVDNKFKARLKNSDIKLVERKKPMNSGFRNINNQIQSMKNAFMAIEDMRFDYALRCRSDQRYYLDGKITMLLELAERCAIEDRLVVSSFNTFYNRLYSVSDMFHVGRFDIVKEYWDVKLDDRTSGDIKISSSMNDEDYARLEVCEQYLMVNYLRKKGFKIAYSQDGYFQAMKAYFFVIDSAVLGFLWPKYTLKEARWIDNSSQCSSAALVEFTNLHWLCLE